MSNSTTIPLDDPTDPQQVLDAVQEYEDHVDGFALGSGVRLPVGFTPNANRLGQLRQFLIKACESFGANAGRLKTREPSRVVHIIAGEDVEELRCRAQSERDYRIAMDAMTPPDAPNQPARRLCGALRALHKSAAGLVRMVRERREGLDFYDPEPAMLFDLAFHRAVELNQGIGNDLAYGLPNPGHLETEVSFYLDDLGRAAEASMKPFQESGWSSRDCVFQGGDFASIWVEEDDLLMVEQLLPRSETLERKLALLAVPHAPDKPQIDAVMKSVEPYDMFISHASEDKEELVRPLADALRTLGVDVWYDEFQLGIGDSLRRSVDIGLANSRFGVVVLSNAFFAKDWPQRELDGLVTLEMAGATVILPIWHGVTKDEVMKFSPTLADRVALNSSIKNIHEIAAELKSVALDGKTA